MGINGTGRILLSRGKINSINIWVYLVIFHLILLSPLFLLERLRVKLSCIPIWCYKRVLRIRSCTFLLPVQVGEKFGRTSFIDALIFAFSQEPWESETASRISSIV